MANKLSRKPLLIPTDVGNVSNRPEAPSTDRENLSAKGRHRRLKNRKSMKVSGR